MSLPLPTPSPESNLEPAAPEGVSGFSATEKDWLLLVAHLHLEQRRPEEACTILRVLHRIDPNNPKVLRCLALAELSAGNPAVAARVATKAMQQDDESGGFRVPVGLIFARSLWEQGHHEAARDYAEHLLREEEEPR